MATTLVGAHAFEHLYAHSIPIIILAITTECELGALSVGAVVVIRSIFGGITSTAGGFLVPDRIISHPSCHDTNLGECSCNLRSSSDSGSKHPASLSTPRPRRSWTKQQARCTPSSESTLTTPCVAANIHLLYGHTSMLFGQPHDWETRQRMIQLFVADSTSAWATIATSSPPGAPAPESVSHSAWRWGSNVAST